MAKITLDTVESGYKSVNSLVANFSDIESELNEKVLYRLNPTGEPNQMFTDLDMNSNDMLNVQFIGANTIETQTLTVNGVQVLVNEAGSGNFIDVSTEQYTLVSDRQQ